MATEYPAIGLQVDLDDFNTLEKQIDRGVAAYGRLRKAATEATKVDDAPVQAAAQRRQKVIEAATNAQVMSTRQILAAQRGLVNAQAQQDAAVLRSRQNLARQQASEAQKAATAEAAAAQRTVAEVRKSLDARVAAGRAAAAEEDRIAQRSLALRQRLNAQQATEAAKVARETAAAAARSAAAAQKAAQAEVAAAQRAAKEQERAAAYVQGIKLRYFREQQAAAERAARAEAAAAEKASRDAVAAAERKAKAYAAVDARNQARAATSSVGGGLGGLLDGVGGNVERFTRPFTALRGALSATRSAFFDVRTAVGVFLGGLIVAPLVRFADQMVALEARIGFFAESSRDVPYLFEAVYESAQRSRAPLEAVGALYTRLAPLADQLGKSQLELLRVTETVQKGIAIGGSSPAEAAAASQQLAQALASNRLGGDELRSLAENAPVLLGAIAKELNLSTGQFIKWAHAGKANTEVVIGALERAAPRIEALFAQFPVTIGQGLTVATNAITKFVGEVNSLTGIGAAIGQSLVDFSRFIESERAITATVSALQALGSAMKFLGSVTAEIVRALPAIGVALLVVATRAALASKAVQATAFNFALMSAAAGRSAAITAVAMNAVGVAAGGLLRAGSSLLALFGGPWGVAFIAAAAALNGFRNANIAAAESTEALSKTQEGSSNAIERAIAYSDAYGLSTNGLTNTLLSMAGATRQGADAATGAAGAHDQAMSRAQARAAVERQLTIDILRRAAAEATAEGNRAQNSVNGLFGLRNQRALVNLSTGSSDPGVAALAQKEVNKKDAEIAQVMSNAAIQYSRAAQLSKLQTDITLTNPTVQTPAATGSGGGAAANDNKATKGVDGAINRVARMAAEVKGLQAQIAALDVNPLSDIAARIKAAGDEAAAQYTSGKAAEAGFAARARAVAVMKEELQIRLELTKALIEQQRASIAELDSLKIEAAGQAQAQAAMEAYLSSGVESYQGYVAAVNAGRDAELNAAIQSNNLRIARENGATTLDGIADAYVKATGATRQDAEALQQQAQNTAQAESSTLTFRDTMDRTRDSAEAYANALGESQRALTELANLQRAASQTPEQRGASSRTETEMQRLLTQARRDGVALSNDEARAQAEILAIEQQRVANLADLKIGIQDSIRDAFIDTGRFDFSSLRRSLTRELRRAAYDALIAKPITIVVNAAVNVLTNALQNSLSGLLGGAGGGGGGGLLGGIASFLGLNANSPGSYSNGQANAMNGLVDSITGAAGAIQKSSGGLLSGITSLLRGPAGLVGSALGPALLGGTVGRSIGLGSGNGLLDSAGSILGGVGGLALAGSGLSGALGAGIATGASALGLGAASAGALGTLLSSAAVLGPIGAIAGIAAMTLFKQKPSNNGALATFSGDSFSLGGNKRNEETSTMATQAAEGVLAGQRALKDAGVTLTDSIYQIDIGTRDATDILFSSGKALTSSVGNAAAAAETALKGLLSSANFASDAQKVLVESMLAAGAGFDAILAKLEKFAEAQAFVKDVDRQILQLTDPKAFQLAELADQQKNRRTTAQGYFDEGLLSADAFAALNVQLSQLEGLELAEVMKNFAGAVDEAAEKLRSDTLDAAKALVQQAQSDLLNAYNRQKSAIEANISRYQQLSDTLASFISSLNVGPLSGATPGQTYSRTRADLIRVGASAATGDADAQAQIPALGQAFLEASKNNSVTAVDYQRDRALALNVANAAKNSADQQVSLGQQQLDTLNAQVGALITINESVLSVIDAISNLQKAQDIQQQATNGTRSFGLNPAANMQIALQTGYQGDFGSGGFQKWIETQPESTKAIARRILEEAGQQYRISFAQGGVFTNGIVSRPSTFDMGLMGERGSEAIMPLVRTSSGLGVRGLNDNSSADEIRRLREVVQDLAVAVVQGTLSANSLDRRTRKWDDDGLPDVRDLTA